MQHRDSFAQIFANFVEKDLYDLERARHLVVFKPLDSLSRAA